MNKEIKEILKYIDDRVIPNEHWEKVRDYITNLQKENEKLKEKIEHLLIDLDGESQYKQIVDKAIEYLTSYESISTIQGLNNIEQNKELDEKTIIAMTNRHLKVHNDLLNILQGGE